MTAFSLRMTALFGARCDRAGIDVIVVQVNNMQRGGDRRPPGSPVATFLRL